MAASDPRLEQALNVLNRIERKQSRAHPATSNRRAADFDTSRKAPRTTPTVSFLLSRMLDTEKENDYMDVDSGGNDEDPMSGDGLESPRTSSHKQLLYDVTRAHISKTTKEMAGRGKRHQILTEHLSQVSPGVRSLFAGFRHPDFQLERKSISANQILLPIPRNFTPYTQRIADARWASHHLPRAGISVPRKSPVSTDESALTFQSGWNNRSYAIIMQSSYPCKLCGQSVALGQGSGADSCPIGKMTARVPGSVTGDLLEISTTHVISHGHLNAWNALCNIARTANGGRLTPLAPDTVQLLQSEWVTGVPLKFVGTPFSESDGTIFYEKTSSSSSADGPVTARSLKVVDLTYRTSDNVFDLNDLNIESVGSFIPEWTPGSMLRLGSLLAPTGTQRPLWPLDVLACYETKILTEVSPLVGEAALDKQWVQGEPEILGSCFDAADSVGFLDAFDDGGSLLQKHDPHRKKKDGQVVFVPFVLISRFSCHTVSQHGG